MVDGLKNFRNLASSLPVRQPAFLSPLGKIAEVFQRCPQFI